MIYDDIKAWIKDAKKWSFIPGYLSSSLKKQTFKDEPLLPFMLHMAVHVEDDKRLIKWFKRVYSDVLAHELELYEDPVEFNDSYLHLLKKGYLFNLDTNTMRTEFLSLRRAHLDYHQHVYDTYAFELNNTLFVIWTMYRVSNVHRLDHTIEYDIERLDSPIVLTRARIASIDFMQEMLHGVVNKESAKQVLFLFVQHKFAHSVLSRIFVDSRINQWFCDVLERPVEDVLSEILSYQLNMSLEKVSIFVNLIGIDDISSLIDTLIQQRDTVFDPATEIDYDIVF